MQDSLVFEILPSLRGEFYSIDPFTGYVSLARSLIGTTQSFDLVST